jgi:RNA polymerase sigma factor (sigma-70 family)
MVLTDAQLLERFATQKDAAAFEALLARHGPLVWGLCRRLLREPHDAEDAFQATFLVLARRAAAIRRPEAVGSWLYGVAYHLAHKLRARAATRRASERRGAELAAAGRPRADLISIVVWRELRPVLDEELGQLPAKYRAPLVLCYLEGKTHAEAARALGWPLGSLAKRLASARELLRERLCRRGVTVSSGLLFGVLAENATAAAVPAALATATVQAAPLLAASKAAAAGIITAQAATLTEGALRAMCITKLKITAAVLLGVSVLGTGAGIVAYHASARESVDAKSVSAPTVRAAATQPSPLSPQARVDQ